MFWYFFLCIVNLVDLYSFVIGSYVIWTAVAGARYTNAYIKTRRTADLLYHIWKWCGIVLKSSALLSIWVRYSLLEVFLLVIYLISFLIDLHFPGFCHSSFDWIAL